MDAYVYRAALYCEDCAEAIGYVCHTETHDGRSSTCDSQCTPIGPYADGGGEADTPAHCDTCHVFLENPLTHHGIEYVIDELAHGDGDRDVLSTWRTHYRDTLQWFLDSRGIAERV